MVVLLSDAGDHFVQGRGVPVSGNYGKRRPLIRFANFDRIAGPQIQISHNDFWEAHRVAVPPLLDGCRIHAESIYIRIYVVNACCVLVQYTSVELSHVPSILHLCWYDIH